MGRETVEAAMDQQVAAFRSGDQDRIQEANEQLSAAVAEINQETPQ